MAGGQSRRMGFDKQLLQIGGLRLIYHIIAQLSRSFDDVLVVTRHPELYEELPVRVTEDIIPGRGPLSGIHAALSESTSEYIYAVACDMPNFNEAYCQHMMQRLEEQPSDACVTRFGSWIEPFHAFYGRALIPTLEERLYGDNTSVHRLLDESDTLFVAEAEARIFTPDWSLFFNLNTREKIEEYLHLLRKQS